VITTEKLKIFDKYKGDNDAFARVGRETEKTILTDSEWQLIDSFNQNILLINKGLSSSDFNSKTITQIKNSTDKNAFDTLSKKIVGFNDFNKIGQLLRNLRAKIQDDTDVLWTHFNDTKSFIEELESDIKAIESCDRNTLEKIKINFLPTSTYQEISLSNSWGEEFLKMASDFDNLYNRITDTKVTKNLFKKIAFYFGILFLYLLTPLLIMAALGTMVSLKYEVDHGYFAVETNKKLTDEQKKVEFNELDKKGNELQTQYYFLVAGSILTFVTATGLIINRNKILGGQKSST
jgi:hypothetical protein